MDELDAMFRLVATTIGDARIGTPMAARVVVQAGADDPAGESIAAKSLEAVNRWLDGTPASKHVTAEAHGSATALARYGKGQSALVTVIKGQSSTVPLGINVFGTRGVVSLDPAGVGTIDRSAALMPALSWINRGTLPRATPPSAPLKPPYGVLLVTGGFSHQEDYAKAFAGDRRCKLIGIADAADVTARRKKFNAELATTLGIAVLPSLDEALARHDVQIVSVCAEPDRRGPIAVRAAAAGKHVYLDKPLASTLAEIDNIVAAVDKSGVVSQMFSMVHMAHASEIHRIFRSGALGQLVGMHVDLTFAKGPAGTADLGMPRKEIAEPTMFELRDTKRELTNVGVYPTVLLHWLLGERVTQVAASTGNYFFNEHQHNQQEDFGQMLLRTESGMDVSISAGRTGWQSHPGRGLDCTWLIGTQGVAVVDAHRPRLNVWADEEPWSTPPRHPEDPMGFWSSTAKYRAKRAWAVPTEGVRHDVVHFLDRIERGEASDVPAQIGAAATEVLLAAYKSAATGEEVKLPLPRK